MRDSASSTHKRASFQRDRRFRMALNHANPGPQKKVRNASIGGSAEVLCRLAFALHARVFTPRLSVVLRPAARWRILTVLCL